MIAFFHKACAFIRRDFLIESSYKASFVMRAAESIVLLVLFYCLDEIITPSAPGMSGQRYLPFVVIGLGFARYFDLVLRMFSESIRQAQMTGCLEAMLSSQTDCVTMVLMSSLHGLLSGAVQLLLILTAGVVVFGVNFSRINVAATAVVLFFSLIIFMSIGVLSAATVVWLKKGDPITWVFGGLGSIFGGAYFPIKVMPPWMQNISVLLPITYALDALRLTMLQGQSLSMVVKPLAILVAIAAVLLPASLALFSAAVRKGTKEGTLMQY